MPWTLGNIKLIEAQDVLLESPSITDEDSYAAITEYRRVDSTWRSRERCQND
jgi:hypothetical protein